MARKQRHFQVALEKLNEGRRAGSPARLRPPTKFPAIRGSRNSSEPRNSSRARNSPEHKLPRAQSENNRVSRDSRQFSARNRARGGGGREQPEDDARLAREA